MDTKYINAHDYVIRAREALRRGDKAAAQDLGEKAALLVPDLEDAWLILAAADPNPEDALAYARKALELKPDSPRAHRAVEWAAGRAKQAPAGKEAIPSGEMTQKNAVAAIPFVRPQQNDSLPGSKPKRRTWVYASVFGLLICAVLAVAAWSAFSSPVFASILNNSPAPTQEDLWASVNVPKPSVTPIDVSVFDVPEAAETAAPEPTVIPPTAAPTEAPSEVPTELPEAVSTDAPTSTPEATETPGTMAMEIVADTPTSAYVPPNPSAPKPDVAVSGSGVRWIDVDLTNQRVYAYEGDTIVNSFIVSTGTWRTPTVTGQYKIYVKYRSAKMSGPGYYLPDVPYIMYFYKGYGLHGTYWHNNFGTPMSHGCVNLTTSDAAWLFNWASVGTLVNVHY